MFEYEKPEEKPLIASGIIGIFKKMFGNSWGPRLEYILRNVILSLLEYPNATFLDLVRMLQPISGPRAVGFISHDLGHLAGLPSHSSLRLYVILELQVKN